MPFSIRPYRRFLPLGYCWVFLSLITLLLLSNGPAYAEWVELGGIVEKGLTVYTNADSDTIHRSEEMVTLWVLMDFKTTQIQPSPRICR